MFIRSCPLCACDIDLGSKDWRAHYQELNATDDNATPALSLPLPSTVTPRITASLIHYACWRVACLHNGVLKFNPQQFLLFKQCILVLAPLQTRLRSSEPPNESQIPDLVEGRFSQADYRHGEHWLASHMNCCSIYSGILQKFTIP